MRHTRKVQGCLGRSQLAVATERYTLDAFRCYRSKVFSRAGRISHGGGAGMLIYDTQFSNSQRAQLGVAVELIKKALGSTRNFPKNLQRDLEDMLNGQGTNPTMAMPPYAVIAYDPRPNGPWAYTGSACVWLTDRTFTAGDRRLAAVLLHELVHVLCGRELDSEVSEHHLFPESATLNQQDLTSFRQGNWRGRWFRVFKRNHKAIAKHDWGEIELPIPAPQVDVSGLPTQ